MSSLLEVRDKLLQENADLVGINEYLFSERTRLDARNKELIELNKLKSELLALGPVSEVKKNPEVLERAKALTRQILERLAK
jgi:hypothetical protein